MDKSELFKKIDGMNMDELCDYHRAATSSSRIIDVLGVAILFSMILFYNGIVLLAGTFIVYGLANIAASMGRTIDFIEERIVNLSDK
jgi:hypothetical protein